MASFHRDAPLIPSGAKKNVDDDDDDDDDEDDEALYFGQLKKIGSKGEYTKKNSWDVKLDGLYM